MYICIIRNSSFHTLLFTRNPLCCVMCAVRCSVSVVSMMSLGLLFIGWSFFTLATAAGPLAEENWGDGLKVKILYRPDDCVEGAKVDDIIHYHYVGRLFDTGEEFGKRFDTTVDNM